MSTIKDRMEQAERLLFMEKEAHSLRYEINTAIVEDLSAMFKIESKNLSFGKGECIESPTGKHIHETFFFARVGPCLVCGFKEEMT